MLTLTRKPGESIVIDDPNTDYVIIIDCKEIRRNQVRLGLTAPDHVKLDRAEVYIKRAKEGTP